MSATHRSLARLPNILFADLSSHRNEGFPPNLSSVDLQKAICAKLKEQGGGSSSMTSSNGGSKKGNIRSITTVGQIIRLTPPTLLRVLDPLLTNGEK